MKHIILFLFTILTGVKVNAQTECITVVAYPEKLEAITTKVLKTAATYSYVLVPATSTVTELVTEVICPSYTHVYYDNSGKACKKVIPAKTYTYLKVVKEEQPPYYTKVKLTDDIWETITKCVVITDGKVITYNSNCN
jgi:hypothetical protein